MMVLKSVALAFAAVILASAMFLVIDISAHILRAKREAGTAFYAVNVVSLVKHSLLTPSGVTIAALIFLATLFLSMRLRAH